MSAPMTREQRTQRLADLRARMAARHVTLSGGPLMSLPLHRRVAFAISDPGAITPRGDAYREPLPVWQARAVASVLPEATEVDRLRAEVARWRERAEEAETSEAQLKGRVRGLRACVDQLEAARTTAAADRDKQIIAWLEKKAREEGTSNKDSRVRATATYRLADKLSRGAVRPACPPVSPEDPHDSPLHHSYALGRDLPEDPCRPCGCPKRFERHADGCPTECPSCAAPADVTGYRIPQHRDGCPRAVSS